MRDEQIIFTKHKDISGWLQENNVNKCLVVCGKSVNQLHGFYKCFHELSGKVQVVNFSDFQPNPLYESVTKGVQIYRNERCDAIVAIGGGSAIDVAKCIKLFSKMQGDGEDGEFLRQELISNDIPFLTIPTTAGTGSETTRYAVVYYNGDKQSITSEDMIPTAVLLDPNVLKTLPLYQRKVTMLDAFSHALESFWSVNSTEESRLYSKEALMDILRYNNGYILNTEEGNKGMQMAAYKAGKAINITQTTAGHAMCYKMTSILGIAHGHAAALCNSALFPWILNNLDRCADPRGKEYLTGILQELAETMGCINAYEAAVMFEKFLESLELNVPKVSDEQYKQLCLSVNLIRLRNHPVFLDDNAIESLYRQILF